MQWLNGILGLIVIVAGIVGIPTGTWKIILIVVGLIIAVLGFKEAMSGRGGSSSSPGM